MSDPTTAIVLTPQERDWADAAAVADRQAHGWHRKRWCVVHDDLIPRRQRVCSIGGYSGDDLACVGTPYVGGGSGRSDDRG